MRHVTFSFTRLFDQQAPTIWGRVSDVVREDCRVWPEIRDQVVLKVQDVIKDKYRSYKGQI